MRPFKLFLFFLLSLMTMMMMGEQRGVVREVWASFFPPLYLMTMMMNCKDFDISRPPSPSTSESARSRLAPKYPPPLETLCSLRVPFSIQSPTSRIDGAERAGKTQRASHVINQTAERPARTKTTLRDHITLVMHH